MEMATCPGSVGLQKAKRRCSSFGKKHGDLKTSNPAPQSSLFYFGVVFVDVVYCPLPLFFSFDISFKVLNVQGL